jgi:murein L,D-transpeptidase YcbB/YkuD
MELGKNNNPLINKTYVKPAETDTQAKTSVIANQEAPVTTQVRHDDSSLEYMAHGSATTYIDLGLDDEKTYSAEEGEKIATQFGYTSVSSLQSAVGVPADGILGINSLNKLKDHLSNEKAALVEGLKKEIPLQMGVNSLAEAQKKLGVTADGVLGPKTLNELDNQLNTDNIILNTVNAKLKAQEFKAMIKVLQVNLQMTDEVLRLLDNH